MIHLFVINPKSFRDTLAIEALQREITRCFDSWRDYHIHISRYPRDAVGVVGRYAALYPDGIRVYAVGGDGILFDCLNGLVGYPEAELAAVPYGSTNDFVRAIREGGGEKKQSIRELLTAPSARTDIVHCGSNYFVNFCAIGLESAAILKWYRLQERLYRPRQEWLVHFCLTFSGVVSLLDKRLRNQNYRITIDGQEYDDSYVVVNFSNGPCYGGNKSVVPQALFNDGLIDVIMVKSAGLLKLLSVMPGYLGGRYAKYPQYIKHVRAREITIHSDQPLIVNLDGEYFLDTSITLKVMPAAVKMIAAGGSAYEREARL